MTVKVWNKAQVAELYTIGERYRVPMEAIAEVGQIIERLDAVYGSERDADNDDGGFVLLLLPDSGTDDMEILYHGSLEQYGLSYGTAEMEGVICTYGGMDWLEELYLTTNDYGITVIYPKENHM